MHFLFGRRPWYERAIANPGQLALSSVYEDASGQGKVVTLSQAVHQPSSVTPADCSGEHKNLHIYHHFISCIRKYS